MHQNNDNKWLSNLSRLPFQIFNLVYIDVSLHKSNYYKEEHVKRAWMVSLGYDLK